MDEKAEKDAQVVDQPDIPPFDDIQDLYIGPIEKAPGMILTDQGDFPITVWGEVLLYGRIKGDIFVVERLRRVALYGALEKPQADIRVGDFSLAGPLEEPALETGSTGSAAGLVEQLHYAALSSELEPFIQSDHAVFPQVEQIASKFSWEQQGIPDEKAVQINISFTADELVDRKLGIVQRIALDPITVNFFLAGTGAPSPEPHQSLQSNCPAPAGGACPAYQQTFTRSLPLKFINFSSRTPAAAETLCNTQIQKLCEVWRNKAALQFVVQSTLIQADAADRTAYSTVTPTEETSIAAILTPTNTPKYASTTQIEIYLIDQFTVAGGHGGGISYNGGQSSAYCILAVGLADANPYLLAHELGHVLGLSHPDGTMGLIDSSPGSIMQPATPNPNKNTLFNCRVFLPPQPLSPPALRAKTLNCVVLNPQPPLNPILSSPAAADCFRPDVVDHFIRDFPGDVGNEPVPSGQNVWSTSNVWNRNTNTTGTPAASGAPAHQEPTATGTNYMYVKLENRTTLADPVTVELYVANPGASTALQRLNLTNHRLKFCPPPVSPNAAVQYLTWTVQAGFAPHCCVFAISMSDDEPTPVANPTAATFATVAPLVRAKNGIAQRNLNIGSVPAGGSAQRTALGWVQMDNPRGKAVSADLEIDAIEAVHLQELLLEVDNEIVSEIKPGESFSIHLTDALQANERKILRLHATLLPDLPVGTQFPIHLRFLLDKELINGYTHEIRLAPMSDVVIQVLNVLYCALRDAAIGCEIDHGNVLAEKARKIVVREQLTKGPSSGCLGLLWRIFRSKNAWRSEVAGLSKGIASLAQSLETRSEPECQAVQKHLYELAGLLLAPENSPTPVLIEQIRELADRIQEPAGQLVRQKLSF